MPELIDGTDAKILSILQEDAGLSVGEIAEQVGLSTSPCWRRIKRLEDTGIIQKRVTLLDREKLGLAFEVFAEVKLALPTRENLETFERAIVELPEVIQCATVTGGMDYVLRVVTRDMHTFDEFIREKLLSLGLVSQIESRIVMRSVKSAVAPPLELVIPDLAASRPGAAVNPR